MSLARRQNSTDLLKFSLVDSKLRFSNLGFGDFVVKLFDRVLEPVERLSEILFGLIMALTITGAVSVVTADHAQMRTMLFAALGCNLAWGIIDGGMYLMARLGERGRNAVIAQKVREAANPENAHRIIANELPPLLGSIFEPAQLEFIRERITHVASSNFRPVLTSRDWLGALGIFILVVLSTFPVVIPFIVFEDARTALRTSNALAVLLLFVCGFLYCTSRRALAVYNGRDHGGERPFRPARSPLL